MKARFKYRICPTLGQKHRSTDYYTDEHINQIKGIVKNSRINVIYCRVSGQIIYGNYVKTKQLF